ncbi:hypothetical protein ACF0H5_016350 [Mactra antiquata]
MEKLFFLLLCFVFCLHTFTYANDWNAQTSARIFSPVYQSIPVKNFIETHVCRSYSGKKRLYEKMKSVMCGIHRLYVAQMVMALCKERSHFLQIFFSALFDIDNDGTISPYEKRRYENQVKPTFKV